MKKTYGFIILVSILIVLLVPACSPKPIAVTGSGKVEPAALEPVDGSDFKRVVLTEKAAKRLDIQTSPVRMEQVNGNSYKVIPYSAVMYGLKGETWTYTNPEPLVFVRQLIVIDRIEGDLAVLSEGPEVDTAVVTVGAPLLYGTEVGVSK